MKKIRPKVLAALFSVFFACLIFSAISVRAAPGDGGLLTDTSLITVGNGGDASLLLDGNASTNVGNTTVTVTFPEPVTIMRYMGNSTPSGTGVFTWNFYGESGNVIFNTNATASTTPNSRTMSGVKTVTVKPGITSDGRNISEIQLFGAPDTTPPSVPVGLSGTPQTGAVALSWTPNATDTVGYNVFVNGTKVKTVTGSSYTVTGLSDQAYIFEVSAVDAAGNESAKSQSITKTPLSAPDTTPPAIPTSLTGIAGNKQVTLSWSATSDATGFYVFKDGQKIGTSPITGKSYVVGGLTNGTAYTFAVSAVDAVGNESAKSTSITKTPFATLNVHLVPNGTSIIVQVSGGTAPYTVQIGGDTDTFSADTYVISGLAFNTDYVVTVTDKDGLTYTGSVNTGGKVGYIPPTMPDPEKIFQNMLDMFGIAGTIAIAIIGGAIALGIIVILGMWAWRLLKRWLATAK